MGHRRVGVVEAIEARAIEDAIDEVVGVHQLEIVATNRLKAMDSQCEPFFES